MEGTLSPSHTCQNRIRRAKNGQMKHLARGTISKHHQRSNLSTRILHASHKRLFH